MMSLNELIAAPVALLVIWIAWGVVVGILLRTLSILCGIAAFALQIAIIFCELGLRLGKPVEKTPAVQTSK